MPQLIVNLLLIVVAIGFVIGIAAYVSSLLNAAKKRIRALRIAKRAYELALNELRSNPNSPDIRQTTLRLGREYSALTREHKNVTIFDEIALKNDIDAACAGAVNLSSERRRVEKECPHCAEMILAKAKICRFCGNAASV